MISEPKTSSFFPVAEAYGQIYPRPSGENSSLVNIPMSQIRLPGTLFCHVVLKRFTIGQHGQHFVLPKQQFSWPSGGF